MNLSYNPFCTCSREREGELLFTKKTYDYSELASKWSSLVAHDLKPEEFHRKTLVFLAETVHAAGGCFIIKEKGVENNFSVRSCLDGRHFSFYGGDCLNFIQWLNKNRKALTRQQVLESPQYFPIKNHALNFFLQFQAEACVPLWDREDLLGFVVLGARKNGKPYTENCLDVLNWSATQISFALQNIILMEQLRHQKMELETMHDLKSQITANLSHELRTPLTSIIGFAELLSEEIDGPLNREQRKHIHQVLDGGTRLLKTLSALVDMAKMEALTYPLNVSQFHLVPLIENITEEIHCNGQTALNITLNGNTPFVYGDLQLVRQIFSHLLDNAVKYTPRGKIEISANKIGEMLEVCIADTGIGIAEEKLSDIFKGFYQVSGGLTREFQGPGIGLALSKKLVEVHGGRLWVKSKPGHGSCFYFTLPLKPVSIKHRELAA